MLIEWRRSDFLFLAFWRVLLNKNFRFGGVEGRQILALLRKVFLSPWLPGWTGTARTPLSVNLQYQCCGTELSGTRKEKHTFIVIHAALHSDMVKEG